jgi:hypothetical protein
MLRGVHLHNSPNKYISADVHMTIYLNGCGILYCITVSYVYILAWMEATRVPIIRILKLV